MYVCMYIYIYTHFLYMCPFSGAQGALEYQFCNPLLQLLGTGMSISMLPNLFVGFQT